MDWKECKHLIEGCYVKDCWQKYNACTLKNDGRDYKDCEEEKCNCINKEE